ncbi:MAG: hydrolase, partial [Flavobacteriaceae bacterium]
TQFHCYTYVPRKAPPHLHHAAFEVVHLLPINYNNVDENISTNETIFKNPKVAKILSAVKLSGRTKKGLGIAVLDAITDKTEAIIKNEITNTSRKEVTEPVTNYNVLVIDQEFNKNSSVSFVNTNVSRSGNFRNANASAFLFSLANKANSKNLDGYAKWNTIKDPVEGNSSGYSTGLSYDKTKGNFRFGLRHRLANETYDINDLGFQQRNNYNSFFGNISYRIFKPTKHFYTYRVRLNAGMFRRFNPSVYSGNFVNLNFFATTLSQFSFGGSINGSFGEQKDYYESRNDVNYYIANPDLNYSVFISSDFRKKFAYNASISGSKKFNEKEIGYSIGVTPIYRASDKFFLSYSINYEIINSQKGYVDTLNDDSIIFGIRDNKSWVNSLSGKYSFNDLASLSITFRYNWSPVSYENNYYKLENTGYLSPSNYTANNNVNFNSWNFDVRYIWQFTRGSELVVLYRNSIFNEDNQSQLSFSNNLNNLFQQSLQQNLSIRLVYYLDYNKLKSWL